MKYTLLDMTQTILSAMDSEEVNSIEDTAEARQVATVIRTAYFNMAARASLPESKRIYRLDNSGDLLQPVLLIRPSNIASMEWIKYNKEQLTAPQDVYSYVTILPIPQFMDLVHQLNIDDDNVEVMDFNGNLFYYRNDVAPCYCTVVDDVYVIFDSYDIEVDDTLKGGKTMCYGQAIPNFTMANDFVPELDDQQFPLLLNEAKSLAFFELKQQPHEKAEAESRRQWRTLQRTKTFEKRPALYDLPDFGRRSGMYGSNRMFRERG